MNVIKIKLTREMVIRLSSRQLEQHDLLKKEDITFINSALGHAEYFSLESIWNALKTGKNKFFIGDECEINHILDCFCDHLGIENTGVRRFVLEGAKFYFVSHDDFKKPLFGGLAGDVYYAIPQQPSDIEAYLIDSLSCHSRYYVTKYQGLHNK
ncbi:hypothetical protein [Proteus terrae]|uniref:hypothetical protein n=1 Tax=Proteus terrae TaxID=1574161 RepID=UPI0025AF9E3E|nr:hypothetical protein [Proteus terrae]